MPKISSRAPREDRRRSLTAKTAPDTRSLAHSGAAQRRRLCQNAGRSGGDPMQKAKLGTLGAVSRLTLGGGGIGLVWGEASREEAIATLRDAVDAGIDLIDTAPLYGACEAIIAETFDGKLPKGVRITSKGGLASPPAGEVAARLEATLDNTLKTMRLERVDLYFLHSNIAPDDYAYAHGDAR